MPTTGERFGVGGGAGAATLPSALRPVLRFGRVSSRAGSSSGSSPTELRPLTRTGVARAAPALLPG